MAADAKISLDLDRIDNNDDSHIKQERDTDSVALLEDTRQEGKFGYLSVILLNYGL